MNREQLINEINRIKPTAIYYGFDFPTQSYEAATTQGLLDFFNELEDYVIQEIINQHEAEVSQ